MRILMVADSRLPVPPPQYGGTERVLSYLIDGVHAHGHDITLLGRKGSTAPARLVPFDDLHDRVRPIRGVAKARFWWRLSREVRRHDVMHSVARLDYLVPALRHRIPKVLHFHNPLDDSQVRYVTRQTRGRTIFVPVGKHMRDLISEPCEVAPIQNGIPVSSYDYRPQAETPPYLVFLARMTPTKGPDIAIRVARAAGLPLVLAGPINTPSDREFFDAEISPSLGPDVTYVGEVGDREKNELLGGATALLFTIRWADPCPLPPMESLACGTPVVAASLGELPHIVRDGVTGYLCNDETEMAEAARSVTKLDRSICRREAEGRFDVSRMIDEFLTLYTSMVP